MHARWTPLFIKDYKKLTLQLKKRVIKQVQLLSQNPRHPSLHIKKIRSARNIFEGRISKSCRFTFHIEQDALVLRRVGEHDKTLKNP